MRFWRSSKSGSRLIACNRSSNERWSSERLASGDFTTAGRPQDSPLPSKLTGSGFLGRRLGRGNDDPQGVGGFAAQRFTGSFLPDRDIREAQATRSPIVEGSGGEWRGVLWSGHEDSRADDEKGSAVEWT